MSRRPKVADQRDRIHLRDHRRRVEIGAFAEERGRTQELRFDLWAEIEPREAADDDVDRVLSYDRLLEAIDAALGTGRVALLETLAERIAAPLLAEPQVARVGVRIGKLGRVSGALGVDIVRAATAAAPATLAEARPRVVFLSAAAARSERLGRWLDELADEGALVAPDYAETGAPTWRTGDAEADRRIALLALGQAAWALTAHDPRLAVVASRTEIVAASRAGRLVVWAPEKLVADAAEEAPGVIEPGALAAWLARRLDARVLLAIGAEAPEGGRSVPLDAEALR